MTSAERRALLFLSAVAVLGAGVRVVRGREERAAPSLEARQALARHIQRVDSAERSRGRARRPKRARKGDGVGEGAGASRPRRVARDRRDSSPERAGARGEAPSAASAIDRRAPVDLDVADAAEIERLPRIGPALARRIVASRDSLGPFGDVKAVERVRGVGPKLAAAIAPHVTFSGRRRPSIAVPPLSHGASPGQPSHRPRT